MFYLPWRVPPQPNGPHEPRPPSNQIHRSHPPATIATVITSKNMAAAGWWKTRRREISRHSEKTAVLSKCISSKVPLLLFFYLFPKMSPVVLRRKNIFEKSGWWKRWCHLYSSPDCMNSFFRHLWCVMSHSAEPSRQQDKMCEKRTEGEVNVSAIPVKSQLWLNVVS